MIEPPCTERYARWCERTANQVMVSFLLDSNIQFGRNINLVGYIFSVFLALTHAFGQQIFNLAVYGAKIVFGPCGDRIIQFGRQAQRHLLFLIFVHTINTSCRNLQRAVHRGFRTARPVNSTPSQPYAPRPKIPFRLGLNAPTPFRPCRRHRLRSYGARR